MKRAVILTNIPTPYRNTLYEALQHAFAARNIALEVWYMAATEPNRNWTFSKAELAKHDHKIFPGLHLTTGRHFMHFNPGMILKSVFHPGDILIAGGNISVPSFHFISLCHRFKTALAWIENNTDSEYSSKGFSRWFKRMLLGRYDGYVVPGVRSKEYITGIDKKAASKPFITLPNIINEQVFCASEPAGTDHLPFSVKPGKQLWACVARLEKEKGLLQLLEAIKGLDNVQLVIAGEGSMKAELQSFIDQYKLDVQLAGHVEEQTIATLYRHADVFVLPSLQDPNPIAAIEAAASGLPLLLSVKCGNYQELVAGNGWSIDPHNMATMRAQLAAVAAMDSNTLRAMGAKSKKIFEERFSVKSAIPKFADQVANLIQTA